MTIQNFKAKGGCGGSKNGVVSLSGGVSLAGG
jgi:hypothetical protein